MNKVIAVFLSVMCLCSQALAGTWTEHLSALWDSHEYDLMVPLNTWHNRLTYDHDKIKDFNERPWGLGFDKRYYDEDKDLHALGAMVFMDSHNDPEPLVGYQFQKKMVLWSGRGFFVGAGLQHGCNSAFRLQLDTVSVCHPRFCFPI